MRSVRQLVESLETLVDNRLMGVLCLHRDNVRLYEAGRHGLDEVELTGVPRTAAMNPGRNGPL